jgi:hypothetical protein
VAGKAIAENQSGKTLGDSLITTELKDVLKFADIVDARTARLHRVFRQMAGLALKNNLFLGGTSDRVCINLYDWY